MPHTESTFDRPPTFDRARCRYERDGRAVVLFSHHHAIHLTRLFQESPISDGPGILRRTAERIFRPILEQELANAGAASPADRWEACRSYWAWCGLGNLSSADPEADPVRVEMARSQLDEGWLRAWGNSAEPINHLARGYLAAAWAAMQGATPGAYEVDEIESLAAGRPRSVFLIRRGTLEGA